MLEIYSRQRKGNFSSIGCADIQSYLDNFARQPEAEDSCSRAHLLNCEECFFRLALVEQQRITSHELTPDEVSDLSDQTLPQSATKERSFDFPLPAVEVLQELAVETGETTLVGVLRDALKIYTWIIEEQKQGHRIVSEDEQGQQRYELAPLLKEQRVA